MMRAMLKAESLIAAGVMGTALYFMSHAIELPIGWEGRSGPGGGAFPFWLSAIMLVAAGGILLRSLREGTKGRTARFFDPDTLYGVIGVTIAFVATIAALPIVGAYVAIPLFMVWYLRFFGQNSWTLTMILSLATPVVIFFFFEVSLKILMPKGITEPLFFPLYAIFF
jgi:putative tricarboxylic transport membrane protein